MAERPDRGGPGDRRRALFLAARPGAGGRANRFRARSTWARPAAFLRGALGAALLAFAWSTGCAPPAPEPAPDPEVAREAEREATRALEQGERLHEAGEHARAASLADSLESAWRPLTELQPFANRALWLRARALEADGSRDAAARSYEELVRRLSDGPVRWEAVRRWAAARAAAGEHGVAVRILLDHPEAVDEEGLARLREFTAGLSDPELEGFVRRYAPDRPGAAPLHAERGRRLLVAGRRAEAGRIVQRLLAAEPPPEERRVAETMAAALEGEPLPIRIGAILPLTGAFAPVGELLREGIELAVAEFEVGARRPPPVELLIEDDGSDPERAPALLQRLEARGAVAVIGPVRSESFAAAAEARRDPRLPLVSPTATEVPAPAPHAYTLWSRERRERDVARDLARWTVRLGLRRAAILYPAGDAGRWAAESFADGVLEYGGEIVHVVSYAPEATTFEEPISAVAEAEPDVVFVVAESVPAVLQLAPQLPYYGVLKALVVGGAIWSDPAVVRRLEGPAADFRVVGTFVDRVSEDTPWDQFRVAYEAMYNKPLRENMLPALAFDATRLVLEAAGALGWLPLPGLVSESLARSPERPGATGWLRPHPESSTVQRRTLVRMILGRELVEPEPERIFEWLEEARVRAEEEATAAGSQRP